ncbi:hypothetical protein E2C01_042621 [Portunus trituberculatus]|uniref:Uncharacterized protein n=1 Tax=Portunus trituberculatus TaxID=210409 RepID=A0A5B7FTI0_PORTR|nr:hypothetical protein [Portunus trituberculatus]
MVEMVESLIFQGACDVKSLSPVQTLKPLVWAPSHGWPRSSQRNTKGLASLASPRLACRQNTKHSSLSQPPARPSEALPRQ